MGTLSFFEESMPSPNSFFNFHSIFKIFQKFLTKATEFEFEKLLKRVKTIELRVTSLFIREIFAGRSFFKLSF